MSSTTIIESRRGPPAGVGAPRQSVATVNKLWEEETEGAPDWVVVLAEACDAASQGVVARRIGMSISVVSAVINRNYKGSTDSIQARVRGALMSETVDCPVLGDLRRDYCFDHQKRSRGFAATSTMRVRMFQACRGGCVHSRLTKTVGGDNAQS